MEPADSFRDAPARAATTTSKSPIAAGAATRTR
jgi:hypothetical protein